MPTEKFNLGAGTITITDESGKEFELGEISETEFTCEQDYTKTKFIKAGIPSQITLEIKMTWGTKLRLKWELFKAKRRMKKIIKALYDDNAPHEFTITLKR